MILTEKNAQESRKHAKILTNAHQVELRAERLANLRDEIRRKKDDHMSVIEYRVSDNKICKDKLQKLMK